MATNIIIIIFACFLAKILLFKQFDSFWANEPNNNISFPNLYHEVMGPIPYRAPTWGDLIFGLYSGWKTNLIQVGDGEAFFSLYKAASRSRVEPKFLVLRTTIMTTLQNILLNKKTTAPGWLLHNKFHINLFAITYAYPYGFIYTYKTNSNTLQTPLVSAYTGRHGFWIHQFIPEKKYTWGKASQKIIATLFSQGKSSDSQANHSYVIHGLPQGFYLITLNVQNLPESPASLKLILGSDKKHIIIHPNTSGNSTSSNYTPLIIQSSKTKAYVLIHHETNGPIYLSEFGRQSSPLSILSIKKQYPSLPSIQLTPLHKWSAALGAKLSPINPREKTHLLNTSKFSAGYQLTSNFYSVPINQILRINFLWSNLKGKLSVGILGKHGHHWISQPNSNLPFIFNTKDNPDIQIVLLNSNHSAMEGKSLLYNPNLTTLYAYKPYALTLTACLDGMKNTGLPFCTK